MRSTSSSPSSFEGQLEGVGVAGMMVKAELGSWPRSDRVVKSNSFEGLPAWLVDGVAAGVPASNENPRLECCFVTTLRRTSRLDFFMGSKSRSSLRISTRRRNGALSAELSTTLSPGGMRTIRWWGWEGFVCAVSVPGHQSGRHTSAGSL